MSETTIQLDRRLAKVSSVKPRQEIHGEDRVLAWDVHVAFEGEGAVVAALTDGHKMAWWRQDPDKSVKVHGLIVKSPIAFKDYGVEFRQVIGDADDEDDADPIFEIDAADVDKFAFTPKGHGIADVSCRIQFHASATEVSDLVERMGGYVSLCLIPRQGSLALSPVAPDPEPEPDDDDSQADAFAEGSGEPDLQNGARATLGAGGVVTGAA